MVSSKQRNKRSFLQLGKRGGFARQSLRCFCSLTIIYLSLVDLMFPGGLNAFAASPPPCPLWLRSSSPEFSELRRSCDFNRRRLPRCAEGQVSLSEARSFDGERRLHPKRRECTKEWTVIGYLAMDNNLSEFGEENLSDLFWAKAHDPKHHVDLVVQADFKDRPAKRYVFEARAEGGRPSDAVLKDFREQDLNSGDPRELEEFLHWAIEHFPSKHYLFIVGGHGDGWAATTATKTPTGALASSGRAGNGIAFDEKHNAWISVPDLRRALTRIEAELLDGEPLDIYAADACFMQQAEVVWDLRRQARFLYGSVPIMAYQGLPYSEITKRLANHTYDSQVGNDLTGDFVDGARRLALDLPTLMVESYQGKNDRVFASVVDTAEMELSFILALSSLGDAAVAWLIADPAETMSKQFRLIGAISESFKHQNSVVEFRDFLNQWRRILIEPTRLAGAASDLDARKFIVARDLLAAIDSMEDALKKSVVSWSAGSYFQRLGDRIGGLSVWLPSSIPHFMSFQAEVLQSNMHRHFCDGCPSGGVISREEAAEKGNRWHQFIAMIFRPYVPPLKQGN